MPARISLPLRTIAALVLTLCTVNLLHAADDPFAAISPKMQSFVDKGEISGIVTLIATRDKVLFLNSVGQADLATGRKMETTDLFWIASMSKPITAVCAAILVDDGKLSFDDPVEKFIPEFHDLKVGANGQALSRPVTVRDLLTHTGGLPEYSKTDPHWTLEQFTRQIASQPLRYQPGTRWLYSTAGIDAVGRIIEVAAGQPFADFMQKRLLDPLSMKNTSFWITPETEKHYAKTYRLNPQTNKLVETPVSYFYGGEPTDQNRPALGGAGLISTAEDIAKFYQMILGGGSLNGHQILKPQTTSKMTSIQSGTLNARPGMPWGFGFCLITDPNALEANKTLNPNSFGHGGAYGTSSWADPTTGMIYIQLLERDKLPNPDNSPMHIAFQQLASEAITKLTPK